MDRKKIRVLLADDNETLRTEIYRKLNNEFEIVGSVENGQALLDAFDQTHPDVVVTDISMPVLDGFEAAEKLARYGNPPIVFLTVHEDRAFIDEARSLGVLGYVLKRSDPSILATAIRSVFMHHSFLCPELSSDSSGQS